MINLRHFRYKARNIKREFARLFQVLELLVTLKEFLRNGVRGKNICQDISNQSKKTKFCRITTIKIRKIPNIKRRIKQKVLKKS